MHEASVPPTPHPWSGDASAPACHADVVFDLGSSDGRIPVPRPELRRARRRDRSRRTHELARCKAREAGMERLVDFRQADLFRADLREATVVTLFLFPDMNRRLLPKLRAELRPGTRIVSHRFGLGDWAPERTVEAGGHPLLLWTVP
jgi:hypothetical protein